MKTNVKQTHKTHEGGPAQLGSVEDQLKRAVMACMLWEDTFYESGESIADRIHKLASQCKPQFVADLAEHARTAGKMRHAPLWLLLGLTKSGKVLEKAIYKTINRADEMAELLAMYWKDGKKPIPAAMKRGLAKAFTKFDEYQFAKYDRDGAVKLRDVALLVHPTAINEEQIEVFKRILDKKLKRPDTWESRMASGEEDKKTVFTDLLKRKKLGYMALMRNLRGMTDAGVDEKLIKKALLEGDPGMILPFRFISAAKHAPRYEPELDQAMQKAVSNLPKLPGKTVLAVDVSGSMGSTVSGRSELPRWEAAAAMAILLSGICEDFHVVAFATDVKEVPTRKGLALRDAIHNVMGRIGYGTNIGQAVKFAAKFKYDRIIVITDMQAHDHVGAPNGIGWMMNVASYQPAVGYGAWNHIDGFSEAAIKFIVAAEEEGIV